MAWAPDGTVEGIEDDGERLVLGVQWHAETLDRGGPHPRLFEALVAAALGERLDLAAVGVRLRRRGPSARPDRDALERMGDVAGAARA